MSIYNKPPESPKVRTKEESERLKKLIRDTFAKKLFPMAKTS
jgi:hypothetical protein